MKKLILTLSFVCTTILAMAQAPQKMSYQAVIRDASGALLQNSNVGMNFNIRQSSPTGTIVYNETTTATTNVNGLVTYVIGSTTAVDVQWDQGTHYLEVNIDPTGGTNYTINSTTQLISVPYALYAETASSVANDQVDDADADPTNEIQSLSLSGNDLSISGGNTITLPAGSGIQTISQSGSTITLSDGGGSVSINDADADPTNEIQTATLSGSTVTLSNGGGSFSINDADSNPTNEIQTATLSGSTVTLSNGGGSFSINDADSNPTNEIQTLSVSGSNLTISGGNTVTLPSGSGGNTLDQAYDQGGAGAGRIITADAGEVEITTPTASGIALRTTNSNTGVAILATSANSANTFSTIQSSTASNSTAASAVIGNSSGAAWGVSGQVQATGTATAAVYGSNLRTNGGHGMYGIGVNGVVGETNYSQGNAVWGQNNDALAPLGNGVGTAGIGYYGVVGEDLYAGGAAGAYGVLSNGDFGATGAKTFIIDHPEDPENKFLRHFSTESNEVLNMYRGNVTLDENGEAIVELPDYYESINTNPSYHLTPIGGFAQLYIKEEIEDGKFVIAGGSDGLKVSWTIYSERNDPYFQQYPEKRAVEVEKREGQKGKYFMPQLYDQTEDKKLIQRPTQERATQPVMEIQD